MMSKVARAFTGKSATAAAVSNDSWEEFLSAANPLNAEEGWISSTFLRVEVVCRAWFSLSPLDHRNVAGVERRGRIGRKRSKRLRLERSRTRDP